MLGAGRGIALPPERGRLMFKILELDSRRSAAPTQIGEGFATWEDALAAIKRHLKGFKVSGRNPEGSYWWTRDAGGLRKCWIAENPDGASGTVGAGTPNGLPRAPVHAM